LPVIVAGVLAATIGVMNEPGLGTACVDRLRQGVLDEAGFEMRSGGPADDFAAVKVHDRRQVKPALLGGEHISDIADPYAIDGLWRRCHRQHIAGNRVRMPGVSRLWAEGPFLAGFEPQGAHMPGHAIAATGNTQPAQTNGQTRAAINLTLSMEQLLERLSQTLICLRPCAGNPLPPGVIGTTRHPQGGTQSLEVIITGHTLDQGIPPGGRSESMPIAFFRIS